MSTCANPDQCGKPQQGAGRPRNGWIRTHIAGDSTSGAWWCSTDCLAKGLSGVSAGRVDVGACPLCINRHDRDHRCGICNTQPQLTRVAPPRVRLYDQSRRDTERAS